MVNPTSSPDEERPLGELLSDLTSQVQALVRKEMELAKAEVKEEVSKAGKGIGAFAAAGVVAFIAAIVLAFAAAWGLAELIATGLAFLVVGVLLLAVAAVAALKGKAKLAEVSPMPEQTVETVKQDVETAKESLQRGASGPTYPDPWRN
ncbi:MAG: phage holin family protein [Acidimicrobiales bacterium]